MKFLHKKDILLNNYNYQFRFYSIKLATIKLIPEAITVINETIKYVKDIKPYQYSAIL